MSTRLDKLLSLLKAPAPFTRRAATQRLIEIAREHPLERLALLENLEPFLTHTASEVRLEAAKALEGILQVLYEDTTVTFDLSGSSFQTLSQALFDIHVEAVLKRFDTLCGSLVAPETSTERDVAKGRNNLEQALGLNPAFGVTSQDLVDDSDLKGDHDSKPSSGSAAPVSEMKQEPAKSPLVRVEPGSGSKEAFLVSLLMRHLPLAMDSAWELRHGSALVQSAFAKILVGQREDLRSETGLLSASAVSLAGILILDRFSDFRDDHVSVPVREDAAQAFAHIMSKTFITDQDRDRAMLLMRELLAPSSPWECKLSGMLCLKCLGRLVPDFKLEDSVLELVFDLFGSDNDDLVHVVAEAAVVFKSSWHGNATYVSRLLDASSRALSPGQDADDFLTSSFLSLYHYLVTEGLVVVQDSVTDMAYLLPLLDNALQSVRRQSAELLLIKVQNSTVLRSLDVESIKVLLCLSYQRVLCEHSTEIQSLIAEVWGQLLENVDLTVLLGAACPCFGFWLSCLMVSPVEPALDPTNVISVRQLSPNHVPKLLIGGDDVMALSLPVRTETVVQAQLLAARCLAKLVPLICEQNASAPQPEEPGEGEAPPAESFLSVMRFHLKSNSYHQHRGCLMLLIEVAELCSPQHEVNRVVREGLKSEILDPILSGSGLMNFEETGLRMSEMNCMCKKLIEVLSESNRNVPEPHPNAIFSAEQVLVFLNILRRMGRTPTAEEPYVLQLATDVQYAVVSIKALYAMAATRYGLSGLVTNNDVIRPIFHAVKMLSGVFRDLACRSLVDFLASSNQSQPLISKLARNVVIYLSDDLTRTPANMDNQEFDQNRAILSLDSAQRRQLPWNNFLVVHDYVFEEGMRYFLKELCSRGSLKENFPGFFNFAVVADASVESQKSRLLIQKLQFLEIIGHFAPVDEVSTLLSQPGLFGLQFSTCATIRCMATRAIVSLIARSITAGLNSVLPRILSMLAYGASIEQTCGSVELMYNLVSTLQEKLVGFYPIFVLDLLRCMSHSVHAVREAAATTFAASVALLPLEIGKDAPEGMSEELSGVRNAQMEFIRRMTSSGNHDFSPIPFKLTVEPRHYQQEGIKWLMFLQEYNLNGILADDMGLGKTLMALCAVLMSHRARNPGSDRDVSKSEGPSSSIPKKPVSLVVSPASCVGHWESECKKLFSAESAPNTLYVASSAQAKSLELNSFDHYDLVFTSYDDVRKCRSVFTSIDWYYVVLDEGHVIKNPKSDLASVIFALKARHKLILSGTPVQNAVVELWSAFHFLMPGYLGTQASFSAQYAKIIERSKSPKATEAQFSAAEKALQALHKRTLPFILRRLKTNVLKDLPPKIIQDFYCDLSSVQRELYDSRMAEFHDSREGGAEKMSALSLIRYLRLLCDHPCLVDPSAIRSPEVSGKLTALSEILSQCGIGFCDQDSEMGDEAVKPHRALIFCQFKSVVALLEQRLAAGDFGKVSHLKLDGSVPPSERQSIVDRFNSDPSVDLLLLTTQVGGLGLSLTAADTVIFIDLDWNPARDLQAMDRAHRLGQKSTVTVYRIITRGTLEERIERLQVRKRHIAESVVDSANQSLNTMNTDQLLDLLEIGEKASRDIKEPEDFDKLWNFDD